MCSYAKRVSVHSRACVLCSLHAESGFHSHPYLCLPPTQKVFRDGCTPIPMLVPSCNAFNWCCRMRVRNCHNTCQRSVPWQSANSHAATGVDGMATILSTCQRSVLGKVRTTTLPRALGGMTTISCSPHLSAVNETVSFCAFIMFLIEECAFLCMLF